MTFSSFGLENTAEVNLVILSFVREETDPKDATGKIAEHWDAAPKE